MYTESMNNSTPDTAELVQRAPASPLSGKVSVRGAGPAVRSSPVLLADTAKTNARRIDMPPSQASFSPSSGIPAAVEGSIPTAAGPATVVIADPPWTFKAGGTKLPKYDLMTDDELCHLGAIVNSITGPDSIMLMWATAPMLPNAIRVLQAWGYKYKTNAVWHKHRIGTGYYFRSVHEHVLIGTRGKFKAPVPECRLPSVFGGAPIEKRHSSKPDWLHRYVEQAWPQAKKIELFARQHRVGWTCIGGDLGHRITSIGIQQSSGMWTNSILRSVM